MKNIIIFINLFLFTGIGMMAQVGINTDNAPPDNSSMLDIQSSTKGILIPRMTGALRNAIVNPVDGLMVYQTDGIGGVYYYNGDVWQRIGETDGSETKVTAGANVTVTGTGTPGNPYVINSASTHYVGELFGGGIVFWVDNTGQHGLIVSLVNISTSSAWSNITTVLIGLAGESTWNGNGNSLAVMGQPGHTASAAKLCDDYLNANYNSGIFSDWFLPAIDQLSLIYHTRYILNKNIEGVSGATVLASQYYWSSTEDNATSAWGYGFSNGGASFGHDKGSIGWVRAIRTF